MIWKIKISKFNGSCYICSRRTNWMCLTLFLSVFMQPVVVIVWDWTQTCKQLHLKLSLFTVTHFLSARISPRLWYFLYPFHKSHSIKHDKLLLSVFVSKQESVSVPTGFPIQRVRFRHLEQSLCDFSRLQVYCSESGEIHNPAAHSVQEKQAD